MKILIVDDEYNSRKNTRLLIETLPYPAEEFWEASSGREAIALLKEKPDIVITDMRMPVVDGTSVLEYIESEHIKCAVIVISGYSDFIYTKSAIRSKVVDYLLKPVKEEEFAAAFEKAVELAAPNLLWEIAHVKGFSDKLISRISMEDFENTARLLHVMCFHFVNFESVKDTDYDQMGDLLMYRLESFLRRGWTDENNMQFRRFAKHQDLAVIAEGVADGEEALMTTERLCLLAEQMKEQLGIVTHVIAERHLIPFSELSAVIRTAAEQCLSLGSTDEICVKVAETEKTDIEMLPEASEIKSEKKNSFGEILLYIQEHYAERIDLDLLSAEFYFSKAYISRIFKRKLGVNFITYLTDYRLARAKELLEESDHKVYHISEEVGFSDYSYFCTVFKKTFGISPSEYRAQAIE